MTNNFDCDLSTMIPVEMPRTHQNPGMLLRISEKDQLSMNQPLLKDVKKRNPSMQFRFLREMDFKRIALENKPNAEDVFKFHANGLIVHPDFVSELKMRGYKIPAVYFFKWNEEKNAWVGVLQNEVPDLPDIEETINKAIARKNASKRGKSSVKV